MHTQTQAPQNDVFFARLHTMRADLLAQIAQQRGGPVSRAEVAADHFAHSEDTHAQTHSARDLEFARNERETEELGAIDAALSRLHAGQYGTCIDCSAAIALARLKATPEVARCIHCQEKVERTHA